MVTGTNLQQGAKARLSGGRMDPVGTLPRPQKDFLWEDKPRLLRDLLSAGRPPFVAKYHEGDLTKYIKTWQYSTESADDSVLHFMEMKSHQRVVCKKMVRDRKSSEYVTANKRVEILSSVKGKKRVVFFYKFPGT